MFASDDQNTEITPTDFEVLVRDYLSEMGKPLTSFSAVHNVEEAGHDGTYQIDIKATFEYLGVNFTVLVECKRHSSPIKREAVQILHSRLQSLGAHKGIMFATTTFQSGAKEYAFQHGIALITLIDGELTYETKAMGGQKAKPPTWANIPRYVGQFEYAPMSYYFLSPGWVDQLSEFLFGEPINSQE